MSDWDRYEMVVTLQDGTYALWNLSLPGGEDDPFVGVMQAMAAGAEAAPGVSEVTLVRRVQGAVPVYPRPTQPERKPWHNLWARRS